ncbi:hypothetical protein TTY48_21330 [Tsukamurella sp. TY48]|uniref:hypothetical protein n=1 Tax=Tsukamurella sp. TY48 TaxID=2775495 RepID=UPI001C7E0F6D|nr:hypothetical protein [Tsukamurella sp. TY48]GIZ97521.1 hypothetical protein TTY48_21330 [Tsukamurella sp. TY48]
MNEVSIRRSKYPGKEERSYDVRNADILYSVGAAYQRPGEDTEGKVTGLCPERASVTIRRGEGPRGEERHPYSFTVGGSIAKKDGTAGKRSGCFYYTPVNTPVSYSPKNELLAPAWARSLVTETVTADGNWHTFDGVEVRRTRANIQDLFIVDGAAHMRDEHRWEVVRPHRLSIDMKADGSVIVGAEGPKIKSDGTESTLKGYAVPAPSTYPDWLLELIAQQRTALGLD